jgi:hypothetical protein
MPATLQDYVDLLDSYLCGKIAARSFERRFLSAWQNAGDPITDAEREAGDAASRALEELFYAVDSFRSRIEDRDPDLDLDEEALRERAKYAIRVLQG